MWGRAGLAAVALVLVVSGCGGSVRRQDRKEEESPLLQKAQERRKYGDEDGALALYRKALEKDPAVARAHLELAFLLDRPTRDYVLAIYHYRRYLELRPETDKREMIEERVRMAKLAFAASMLPSDPSGAEHMLSLEKENSNLRLENDYLRNEIRGLRDRVRSMETVSAMGSNAAPRPPGPVVADLPISPGVLTNLAPIEAGPGREPERRAMSTSTVSQVRGSEGGKESRRAATCRVQPGDTLTKIAQRMYGSPRRWREIYQANRGTMRNEKDLRPGQTLQIPP